MKALTNERMNRYMGSSGTTICSLEDMKNSTECVIKLVNGTEQNYFKVWSKGPQKLEGH